MSAQPLLLASASPQRKAILEQLGVAFTVQPADVDELTQGDPKDVALQNAILKARAVPGPLVLGVDTLVAIDGDILGKPRDEAEARTMITRLAGRTHEVHSGIALAYESAPLRTRTAVTEVTFAALSEAVVEAYVATGEWRGRAGGYAIQGRGALLVDHITGDYLNVVGLPVTELKQLAPWILQFAAQSGTPDPPRQDPSARLRR